MAAGLPEAISVSTTGPGASRRSPEKPAPSPIRNTSSVMIPILAAFALAMEAGRCHKPVMVDGGPDDVNDMAGFSGDRCAGRRPRERLTHGHGARTYPPGLLPARGVGVQRFSKSGRESA